MSFFDKPLEITLNKKDKGTNELIPKPPTDLLDDKEYIIFYTNMGIHPYQYLMISSFGRMIILSNRDQWIDVWSAGNRGFKTGPLFFISNGWISLIKLLKDSNSLIKQQGRGETDINGTLAFVNLLMILYSSFFPDSKITSSNNDADKYFEMIRQKQALSIDQMSKVSDILNKMDDQLTKSSGSETSSKKEFNKARKELKKLIHQSRGSLKKLTGKKTKKKKGGNQRRVRTKRRSRSF